MTGKYDHLVVVMLENRSFDNILGWTYSPDNAPPWDKPKHFIPAQSPPPRRIGTSNTLAWRRNSPLLGCGLKPSSPDPTDPTDPTDPPEVEKIAREWSWVTVDRVTRRARQ